MTTTREAASGHTPVTLYAEFTAKPGASAEVEGMLRDYAAHVRAEPGNVVFDAYRRAESPERFFVFEIYRDQAAFEEHLGAPTGQAFNEQLRPLIVEPASQLSFLVPAGAS